MNIKNILWIGIFILGLDNPLLMSTSREEKTQKEVPLFSRKGLAQKMRGLRKNLSTVKRCLFTGPCTSEEMKKVNKQICFLFKSIGVVVGGVAIYKGIPLVMKKLQEKTRGLEDIAANAVQKGVASGLEEVTGTMEKTFNLDEITVKIQALGEVAGKAVQDVIVSEIATTAQAVKSEMPDMQKLKREIASLGKDVGDAVRESVVSGVKEIADSIQGNIMQKIRDDLEKQFEHMVPKLLDIAAKEGKVKMEAMLADEDFRKQIVGFVDNIGEESKIVGLLKNGISVEAAVSKSKLGVPKKVNWTIGLGANELG